MTRVVFVHGVPETAAIWGPLLSHLDRGGEDVEALSPPGFGVPLPAGFEATSDAYAAWLTGELEKQGAPVHLVGHDWGGGHAIRVALERPDLVRSWAIDIGGTMAPDYVWHDLAQVWQTEGAGEEAIAGMVASPVDDRASLYESLGMTPDVARAVAEGATADMGKAILALYRSATQPAMAGLGSKLGAASSRPGLMIIPTSDGYTGGEERARWSAAKAGAAVAVLPGLGHWWMLEDPAAGAGPLNEFWASAD